MSSYGTVDYWINRLAREGYTDLIAAIQRREVSAHAVAVELGWIKRRATGVVDGNHNLSRTREHAMAQVLERSAPPPAFSSEIPCFNCREPCAWQALREIADSYARGRRGEVIRSASGVLPASCCRRTLMVRLDVRAMIA
jgi:hypothetical protein